MAAWNPTPISFFYLLAAALNLAAALMIWSRTELEKEIRRLAVILFLISLWLAAGFIEFSVTSPELKLRAVELEDLFSGLTNLSMFLFVLDYFKPWPWFSRTLRWALWALMLFLIGLSLTNSFHHLVWLEAVLIPPLEDNLARYPPGPLYSLSNSVYISLIALSFVLLIRQVFISPRAERRFVLLLTAALAAPFSAYFIYAFNASRHAGLILMAAAYSLSAAFMVWVVYDHMQSLITGQANALSGHVKELQSEIQRRQQLEIELKQNEEKLAGQIADQNRKISGIYDLILLSTQPLSQSDLQEKSLEKISSILGCSGLCLYFRQGQTFILDNQSGLEDEAVPLLAAIPAALFDSQEEFSAPISAGQDPLLARASTASGFQSALARNLLLHSGESCLLLALWSEPVSLSIEDTALFNALSDGLVLILEIARLSESRFTEARQAERRRLARDLHDSVTQSLHSLTFSAETALSQMNSSPDLLPKILEHLKTSSWQALKEMRLLLYELRLQQPGDTNLQELILTRLEAVERRAGIDFTIQADQTFQVPRNLEVELYPVIMESLNNALKHSRSGSIEVNFTRQAGTPCITIQDHGVGFNPDAVPAGGMGIQNMRERCRKLEAALSFESTAGTGTTVRILLPAQASKEAPAEDTYD